MTNEKAIEMIGEYLLEPNNINKEWVEVLEMCKQALAENNRQKAEIERLQKENESIRYCYEQAKSYNDILAESCEKNCKKFNMTTRTETIKEFAEKLKNKMIVTHKSKEGYCIYEFDDELIDNLVKEMVGE